MILQMCYFSRQRVSFSLRCPARSGERKSAPRSSPEAVRRPGSERSLAAASRESGRAGFRSPRGGSASERSLLAVSREGGRVALRSPRRAARVSGASSRRPGKVGGWRYARLAGQREWAEPRRGVSGKGAGGDTLASQGSASSSGQVVGQVSVQARGGPVHKGKRIFSPFSFLRHS